MHAAPGETRGVFDQAAGERPALVQGLPVAVDGGREHLTERLQGIKDAVQSVGADDGVAGRHEDGVCFVGEGSVVQDDEAFYLAAGEGVAQAERSGDRGGLAAGVAQACREPADCFYRGRIERRVTLDRGAADAERPLEQFGFRGVGDDVVQHARARTYER